MKILIIKTGATESFDHNSNNSIVSYGDVLRTTVLLNLFPNDLVHWYTSPEAKPLLNDISQVKKIYTDLNSIEFNFYDIIINLERNELLFQILKPFLDSNLIGFYQNDGLIIDHKRLSFQAWLLSPEILKQNWSEKLFSLMLQKWSGEKYLISSKILDQKITPQFDLGLNWQVGKKWPTKVWAQKNWYDIHDYIEPKYKVTWQEGTHDLIHYINWINNCKTILTHDSLGLHIALALNKKIVALFGPTSTTECPLGVTDIAMSANMNHEFKCLPCYKDQCFNEKYCMDQILTKDVINSLETLMN